MQQIKLLIAILLLNQYHNQDPANDEIQDCGNGCLMCSANSTTQICQICDSRSFFIRYGFVCQSNSSFPNCAVTSDGKSCTYCNSEYYLDSSTAKCTKLESPIENCLYHGSDKKCTQCNKDFYVKTDGTCAKIEKNIQNCEIYESGTTCRVCTNATVSADKQSCESLNNSTNCAFYSGELYCSRCIDGYRYLPNNYLVKLQVDSNFVSEFSSLVITKALSNTLVFSTKNDVCYKAVEHCLVYGDAYNACEECETGYYYSNNNCTENPKPKIDFCSEYSSETVCTTCLSGYYLSNESGATECKAQTTIENCRTYSRTVKGWCEECEPSYYYGLRENNGVSEQACIKRTVNVANCAVYISDKELCKECRESYELSDTGAACVQRISKCELHEFITGSGGIESLICQQCLPGFYIKTNIIGNNISTSCELPTLLIEGCESYQTETQCVGCKQGYYLANFQCHQHDTAILQRLVCDTKSVLIQNDCARCAESQVLYKLYNYCAAVGTAAIAKCETYSSTASCSQCQVNHYYDSAKNTCVETIIPDCVKLDTTSPKCVKCDLNKSLIPNNNNNNNKCVKIPDYLVSQCRDFRFDLALGTISCKECIAGYYPRQFPKRFYSFCVFQTQLSDFRSGLGETDLARLSGCQTFDFSNKECLYCSQSSANFLINGSTGECTSQCQNDEVAYTFYLQENNPYSFMKCITQNKVQNGNGLENCLRLDFDISQNVSVNSTEIPKYCAECLSGFKPLIDEENSTTFARFTRTPMRRVVASPIKTQSFFSIWNKVPLIVGCYQFDRSSKLLSYGSVNGDEKQFVNGFNVLNYTSEDADSAGIPDDFFDTARSLVVVQDDITQINYFGIKTCEYGYTGVIVKQQAKTNDPDYNGSFVNYCKLFSSCNTSVYYTGLCNHDSNCDVYKLASCSSCSDPTKILTIPYIVQPWSEVSEDLDVNSDANVSPFKTQLSEFTSQMKMNLLNTCAKRGLINSSNSAFPANCAVQLVLDKNLYQYTTDLEKTPNPVCIACKPSFKPTLSGSNVDNTTYKYIKACNAIAQCAISTEYNKCQQCATGYVLRYSESAGNQWLTLAEECVQNTVEGCLVGQENGICRKCKKGYYLNQAGICDTVTDFDSCVSPGAINEYNDAYKHLNDYPFRLGCFACKDTMYSVIFAFAPEVCVRNNANASVAVGSSFFIQNCQSYKFENETLVCNVCATGFYLTSDGGKCISEEISNCIIYKEENGVFYCEICKEKYYLENNKCLTGKIQGCLEYSNKENCTRCESGNIPTRILNNQYTICFDISQSVAGCQDFDTSEGLKGVLKCNRCDSQSKPFLFSLAIKTCGVFYPIEHCLSYSLGDNFQSSSFFCERCETAYYALSSSFPSVCQPRSAANYPINNCLAYTTNADSCDRCISNFYLSANKKQCLPNPNGIQHCRVFESQDTCAECEAGYYVSNKECRPVPELNKVPNCYTYDADLTCALCAREYQLVSNNCQKVVLANCLSIGFGKVCDLCEEGYQFLQGECQKTNISNCIVYKTSNTCSKCEKNYYLTNERCLNADIIPNCEEYAGKKECALCKAGYILENGGAECRSLTEEEKNLYGDDKCHTYLRKVTCSVCDEGYLFEKDANRCIACANLVSGCAYCDPLDTNKCLICQSGKFIDSEGKCSDNQQQQIESQAGVEDALSDFYLEFNRGSLQIAFIWALMVFFTVN